MTVDPGAGHLAPADKLDVRGRRVLLKPNMVEFEPGSVINTHPMLVHAAH